MTNTNASETTATRISEGKKNLFSPGDLCALLALLGSLIVFYPELFLAKSASLAGDHWEQHYPWAYLLASSLKQGVFPWWTSMIQSGFPIAAEGQIGIFYPPNLLLYSFLPFRWAYSYQNVVHFVISGFGTYYYCRQIKLTPFAAWIAAFTFLFGTSYGGAYYNITSLKTLCWFPWILLWIERYFGAHQKRYLFAISVCLALSMLAGYLQMAAFAMVIILFYLFFRTVCFHDRPAFSPSSVLKYAIIFAATFAFGIVLALPQIWLTFNLAIQSTRTGLTEEYAYVGSLFPGALATFVYPMIQGLFRGACIYVGTLPILLTFIALTARSVRQTTPCKLWLSLTLFALFLALGEWSPLYIAIVKLTHFYSFRIPAKFLGFFCFGIAMLAGLGMQAVLKPSAPSDSSDLKKGVRLYLVFSGSCLILLLGCFVFISKFGHTALLELGEWFVLKYVYGRAGHPHDLQAYLDRLIPFMTACVDILRPWGRGWNIWCYSMIVAGMFLALFFNRAKRGVWIVAATIFLFIDLFVFSWNDIKKDFGRYTDYEKTTVTIEKLLQEKELPGFGRLYGIRTVDDALPIVPSANMFYGIEDIGGYSPLINRRYLETIGQLGNVNDSNLAYAPKVGFVLDRLPLLDFLNVTHILSVYPIQHPDLKFLAREGDQGPFLYRNLGRPNKAHFISRQKVAADWEALKKELMEPGFDPKQVVLFEADAVPTTEIEASIDNAEFEIEALQQTETEHAWRVVAQKAGYFVVADTFAQGWQATLNGDYVPVKKAYGLFQAVEIKSPGAYEVRFTYSPWRISLKSVFERHSV